MVEAEGIMPVKVLLVDDEENILASLRRLMLDEEFEVLTANSGREGLALLETETDIGLIISDQRMPAMTGVEFLMQARQLAPEALRILLTGYADINATIDAINKGGASRYITKPWNDEDLLQTVRDAVQKYLLIQENRRLAQVVNRQNEELKEWNSRLKERVLGQTAQIRKQNEGLNVLNTKLKSNYQNVIVAFSGLLELRDRTARSHSRNVRDLAVGAARALDLPEEEVESIDVGALLHDIGEIGIPEAVLGKPVDHMSQEELTLYRQHPVRGQTAIDLIEDLRKTGSLIRHHHENFDGSGFPDGLRETAIPLGARIISMADFIDTSIGRIGGENALDTTLGRVSDLLGRIFDPTLFDVLKKLASYQYFIPPGVKSEVIETEMAPRALYEGLVLSRDICSGTGLLLLGKGAVLDEVKINSIKRYYQLDPPAAGVHVWIKKNAG